ncbi:MAG: histidine phosphatase family protein [Clostridia bacterium]|nr:histidine phosphatase family protein [Clostridia bacterium]
MKIIYVHHAHRDKGNPPSKHDNITALGEEDAALTGKILEIEVERYKTPIKEIYSSPYFRCKKTTEIINKSLNLPIIFDERLNEMARDDGETWVQMQERMHEMIKEIVFSHKDSDAVVIVTSGVNVVAFMNICYRLKPSENAPIIFIPSCSPLIFNISKENFCS